MRALLLTLTTCLLVLPAHAKYSGGSGTAQDPYQIATAADLIALGETPEDYDKHFILTADIDLDPKLPGRKVFDKAVIAPTSGSWSIGGLRGGLRLQGTPFVGVFDGKGKKISHVTAIGGGYTGLFGYLASGGEVRDLGLVDVNITDSSSYVGGLLVYNMAGTVTRCYVTGVVYAEGSLVGGLVGLNESGVVRDCYSAAVVTADGSVGGLAGYNAYGTMTNCYSSGVVDGNRSVGGLVGTNGHCAVSSCSGGPITGCHSTSKVNGWTSVGGLVGSNTGEIAECFSTGAVDGNDCVGGLVGSNEYGTVADCHSTGAVNGTEKVGGLMGSNDGGDVTRCYSTRAVRGIGSYVGGLVGSNGGTVTDCYSTGAVRGTGGVGGLVGHCSSGTAMRCYSTGAISGSYSVGGLVGHNDDGTLTQCYSSAAVSGADRVGGVVGSQDRGRVTHCYSTGLVHGANTTGGFMGRNGGTVTHCYSMGEVRGMGDGIGGFIGINSNEGGWPGIVAYCVWDIETSGQTASANGTGKTTTEMWMGGTYVFWNACGPFWTIDEGRDYPHLVWESVSGKAITDLIYAGGTGTPDDPYLIRTAQQLNAIGLAPCQGGHFKLIGDIDLSGFDGRDGRPAFNIIGTHPGSAFGGIFDGSGHTISRLTIKGKDNLGLFGSLRSEAEIRDLGVVDVNVTGSGAHVGGLVGWNDGGTLSNCYSTGVVSGGSQVGGLVGWNDRGTLTQCHSAVLVSSTGWHVGGIAGESDGVLTACRSTGAVTGPSWVGGLVGWNRGIIAECYSSAAVIGNNCVGGLAAVNAADSGRMTHCYSVGIVMGKENVGGLVGSAYARDVLACFWDTQISGQVASAGGTGKTTVEMQTAKTFLDAGWDFVGETKNGTEDIWRIDEGKDYPRLWWEAAPGEIRNSNIEIRNKSKISNAQ